ncbi:MAG: hypothetical protein JW993_09455 [Sedimentisphaerales bacterium]|nr:hypothetical protein [Sedimentisphaerales bacterium]
MGLFPNELPRLTHRAKAERVAKWLRDHPQLAVSNENRLSKQCRLITETKDVVQDDHKQWRIFVQSLKDVQEFWFIIGELGEDLVQPPFLDCLARSLKDAPHPADSGADTPGRNTQFELFLAAIAKRAGLMVSNRGGAGADWILNASQERWSLEAKRIKSVEKMKRHIEKAASQIIESQIGGVIAIDLSLACNPDCKPLSRFFPDSEIDKAHGVRLNAFVDEYRKSIVEGVGAANVGFVLLHDFVIRPALATSPTRESWGLIELWGKVDMLSVDSTSRPHYDRLWQSLEAAVPNL